VAGEWERTGGAARLVQGFSSLLYLKQESRYAIDEDHINMVRFVLPTDKHYECVVRHIQECVESHCKSRKSPLS
jgi:hypothetical protein